MKTSNIWVLALGLWILIMMKFLVGFWSPYLLPTIAIVLTIATWWHATSPRSQGAAVVATVVSVVSCFISTQHSLLWWGILNLNVLLFALSWTWSTDVNCQTFLAAVLNWARYVGRPLQAHDYFANTLAIVWLEWFTFIACRWQWDRFAQASAGALAGLLIPTIGFLIWSRREWVYDMCTAIVEPIESWLTSRTEPAAGNGGGGGRSPGWGGLVWAESIAEGVIAPLLQAIVVPGLKMMAGITNPNR